MEKSKSLEIIEIIDLDSDLFSDALRIYLDSFPEEERQSIVTIKDRINNRKIKFYTYLNQNTVIGICITWDFSDLQIYFVDYYAIRKDLRSSGFGLQFLTELFTILDNNYSIVLEVEKPNSIEDIVKYKRIKFYKKLNFKTIENFYYLMPSFCENNHLEMLLLFRDFQSRNFLNKNNLFNLVLKIYQNVYEKEHLFERIIKANKNEYYQLN